MNPAPSAGFFRFRGLSEWRYRVSLLNWGEGGGRSPRDEGARTRSASRLNLTPTPLPEERGTALSAREDLDGAVELWVAASCVARVEWDFDRRRDADPFEALTVHQHVLDREQEQPVVADQERRRRQHRAFGAMADKFAEPVFLEPIGEHFLPAAGAFVDQSGHRLAPFHADEAYLAVAALDLHRRRARIEEVEILRLRAAPSAAQVPDQRVGVLERSVGHQVLERGLNPAARIGPDMHVSDAGLVRSDDPRALFKAAQEHLIGAKIGRRYADRDRRAAGGAADLKRNGRSHF